MDMSQTEPEGWCLFTESSTDEIIVSMVLVLFFSVGGGLVEGLDGRVMMIDSDGMSTGTCDLMDFQQKH